jgi:hypothetical protein
VKEFPIFVPCEDVHVAAVVTAPDTLRSEEVVLILSGIGLHRVVGSTFGTRLASQLAGRGIASVRLDYAGAGDSTGVVRTWSLKAGETALAHAESALQTALRGVGARRFAVVGTCIGARIALELARRPDCTAAVALAAPIIDPQGWTHLRTRSRRWPLVRTLRRSALLRWVLGCPLRAAFGEQKPSPHLVQALEEALDHARLVVLYSETGRDHYSPRIRRLIEGMREQLAPALSQRLAIGILPVGPLTAFEALTADAQKTIVETALGWVAPPHPADPPEVANALAAEGGLSFIGAS